MELRTYFSDIPQVFIDHLERAQSEIIAAIAYFTDRELFEVLCKKARSGIKVSVALLDNEINQGPGGLNFCRLTAVGGQVTFLPPVSRDQQIMRHKFCVIDRSTVISGSYDWSHKARSNNENITVFSDPEGLAKGYLSTFDEILAYASASSRSVVDVDAARWQLEIIRNLILFEQQSDIGSHLRKLRPFAQALQITPILTALDNEEYRSALEQIDAYLGQVCALVVPEYLDIPRLRFQLSALELRLESLNNEKTELERRLTTFNRRHDEALGDLIQRLLKVRVELAHVLAVHQKNDQEREKAEAAACDAEEAYRDYAKQHEELQHADAIPELDEEAERELKSLYRKACHYCHPDKVPEERKEAAHLAFVELQAAYKANDLAKVRQVYEMLKAAGVSATLSTTLSKVETLKAAIDKLELAVAKLIAELKQLQASDSVKLMDAAGVSEADWQRFFEQRQEILERELTKLISKLLGLQRREKVL